MRILTRVLLMLSIMAGMGISLVGCGIGVGTYPAYGVYGSTYYSYSYPTYDYYTYPYYYPSYYYPTAYSYSGIYLGGYTGYGRLGGYRCRYSC
ncbi:hypothetical protein BH10PSE19_BH10PSE19_02680 [soil metagenome]